MQSGRPALPARFFDRHFAKRVVAEAAEQIQKMVPDSLPFLLVLSYASILLIPFNFPVLTNFCVQIEYDYAKYAPNSAWTSDIWTGLGQNEFCGITSHFWADDWSRIERRTLDLFYFPQTHTGEHLAQQYEIEAVRFGRPFQITTDKGANMRLGVRNFMGKDGPNSLPFPSYSRLSGIPCFAHGLSNMIKAAMQIPTIKLLYDKQTKAVKFFRKSNKANRALHNAQSELHQTVPNPFVAYHESLGWRKVDPSTAHVFRSHRYFIAVSTESDPSHYCGQDALVGHYQAEQALRQTETGSRDRTSTNDRRRRCRRAQEGEFRLQCLRLEGHDRVQRDPGTVQGRN
jgi:hypothetical protein